MQPTFKTLNDQLDPTFNQLLGINNNGKIAGYFGSGAPGHPNKGYTLDAPYGQGNCAPCTVARSARMKLVPRSKSWPSLSESPDSASCSTGTFDALYLMTSTGCGISAKQLARELKVTYKTAWRMSRLIRDELDHGAGPVAGPVRQNGRRAPRRARPRAVGQDG